MNTVIFIIRHGDIHNPKKILYGSHIEMPLTQKGKDQLKSLAEKIKVQGPLPRKIYVSPMQRTVESADIAASVLGISDIQIENDLRDTDIPASWGKPISIIQELADKGTDPYNEELVKKGNESREQLVDRMYRIFRKAFEENKGNCSIIVSHGDPTRFLLFRIEHPSVKKIPGMNILRTEEYLEKGHAWKFILDENGKLLKKELISPD